MAVPYNSVGTTMLTISSVIKARRAVSEYRRVKALKTYEKGRICSTMECRSILSVYNRADMCFAHQPKKPPRIRGRA